MNEITIIAPRWHDRVVLIADGKLQEHNLIDIKHHDFPNKLYIRGKIARQYPLEKMKTKRGGTIGVRAVPILEMQREQL